MRANSLVIATILVLAEAFSTSPSMGTDLPEALVIDVRLFEARSTNPDYAALEGLKFFVETDGEGVSDLQWLGTIASKVPDAFLATLAFETAPAVDGKARFELVKRSRKLVASVDLSRFLERGTFQALFGLNLQHGEEVDRRIEKTVELRLGQTYVFSGRDLELSPSEYLSQFRDYEGSDGRGELYGRLRDSSIYLIFALTPRIAADGGQAERLTLTLPRDVELPDLESPFDIPLVGSILLYFDVDEDGVPHNIAIARSSLTEVNPRILGEASRWRFPRAAGRKARLSLELEAEPVDPR